MKNIPNNDGHADYSCLLWAAAACALVALFCLGGIAYGVRELLRWLA